MVDLTNHQALFLPPTTVLLRYSADKVEYPQVAPNRAQGSRESEETRREGRLIYGFECTGEVELP